MQPPHRVDQDKGLFRSAETFKRGRSFFVCFWGKGARGKMAFGKKETPSARPRHRVGVAELFGFARLEHDLPPTHSVRMCISFSGTTVRFQVSESDDTILQRARARSTKALQNTDPSYTRASYTQSRPLSNPSRRIRHRYCGWTLRGAGSETQNMAFAMTVPTIGATLFA